MTRERPEVIAFCIALAAINLGLVWLSAELVWVSKRLDGVPQQISQEFSRLRAEMAAGTAAIKRSAGQ